MFESGALYDPKVLDIKDDDLMGTVTAAIARVAAASLELNYPTLASIPHSVVNGYKNVLAVSVATDYDFPLAEKVSLTQRCPDSCQAARTDMSRLHRLNAQAPTLSIEHCSGFCKLPAYTTLDLLQSGAQLQQWEGGSVLRQKQHCRRRAL